MSKIDMRRVRSWRGRPYGRDLTQSPPTRWLEIDLAEVAVDRWHGVSWLEGRCLSTVGQQAIWTVGFGSGGVGGVVLPCSCAGVLFGGILVGVEVGWHSGGRWSPASGGAGRGGHGEVVYGDLDGGEAAGKGIKAVGQTVAVWELRWGRGVELPAQIDIVEWCRGLVVHLQTQRRRNRVWRWAVDEDRELGCVLGNGGGGGGFER